MEAGVLASMLALIYAAGIAVTAAASRYARNIAAVVLVAAGLVALLASRGNTLLSWEGLPILYLHGELGAAAFTLMLFLALIVLSTAPSSSAASVLTLLASAGGLLVLMAASTPVLILGLEACALSIAGLLALSSDRSTSLRYLVASFFASSLIVLGSSMLWACGYHIIGSVIPASGTAALGLALLIAGMAVEVGLAPFHMWVPDVATKGHPLALAAATLTADTTILIALYRVVAGAQATLSSIAAATLAILAVASMVVGEFSALAQRTARRMVGFSIVSDAGYMVLLALAEALTGKAGLWPAIYFATASGAAVALALASSRPGEGDDIAYGIPLAASLLCLAGIPPLFGFAAKLSVIAAFARAGMTYLAVVAAAFFIVAATYNIRFVISNARRLVEKPAPLVLYVYSLLLLILGIAPSILYMLGGGV